MYYCNSEDVNNMSRCPGQDVCEACVRGRVDLRLHQDRGLLGAGDSQLLGPSPG